MFKNLIEKVIKTSVIKVLEGSNFIWCVVMAYMFLALFVLGASFGGK
jgi:hypothetical protein